MNGLTSEQIQLIEKEQKSLSDMSQLEALLVLTNAFDANKIQKRNLQMINEKISRSVFDYVLESYPRL